MTQYGKSLVGPAVEFNKILHREFDVVQDYWFLNMTVVRATRHDVKQLSSHKAYRDAVVCDHPIIDFDKVLRGLNSLQNQYVFQVFEWWIHRQQGVTLPNDQFEGGIFPPGDYPKSDKSTHLVRPDRKYECPPAYMPVLNLSIGPEYARNTHVDYALKILAETRLLTVSAGNDGPSRNNKSTINKFIRNERHKGIVVVGATDESGKELAKYSATGLVNEEFRRPCVVAKPGNFTGTSFSAPKVANSACICFDAVFQVANVESTLRSESAAGVPLVGWGILDELDGDLGLPSRTNLPAMPFLGVYENDLRDAFAKLHERSVVPKFSIHGPPIRQLILDSAENLDGYEIHEIGSGYISEELLLDHLVNLNFGTILNSFCDNIPVAEIPAAVWELKVFDRDELSELARIGNASRPIWVYDYAEPKFVVNRIKGGQLAQLPISHGGKVAAAGANLV